MARILSIGGLYFGVRELLVIFFLLPTVGEGGPSADKSSVVFAVSSSRSFDNNLPDLRYPRLDLERFLAAMTEMGNIPRDRIISIVNPTVKEFEAAAKRVAKVGASKIIFYYSGHADANGLHLSDGLLNRSQLHEFLRGVSITTRIVFLDSCYSGALVAKGVRPAGEFQIPKVEFDEPSGSVFLAATGDGEAAFELEDLKGSLFTHYLVSGLYGQADGNHDGLVTIEELYQFVYREISLHHVVLPAVVAQKPEYRVDLHGRGALVLGYPKNQTEKLTLGDTLQGEITLASETGLRLHRFHKPSDEVREILVYPGSYQIRVKEPQWAGRGAILIKKGFPARLERRDLIYVESGATLAVAKGKSGGMLFGIRAGLHGGLTDYSHRGQYFDLDVATPAVRLHIINCRLHALLGAQKHDLEDGRNAVEGEVLVAISGSYFLNWGLEGQQVYLLLAGGYGRMQDFGEGNDDDRRIRPALQKVAVGLGTSIPMGNGLLWSLDYRREFVTVTNSVSKEALALAGNMLGLALHF